METSKAMLYRNIKDLSDRSFIESKPSSKGSGYRLTDIGKIARL